MIHSAVRLEKLTSSKIRRSLQPGSCALTSSMFLTIFGLMACAATHDVLPIPVGPHHDYRPGRLPVHAEVLERHSKLSEGVHVLEGRLEAHHAQVFLNGAPLQVVHFGVVCAKHPLALDFGVAQVERVTPR